MYTNLFYHLIVVSLVVSDHDKKSRGSGINSRWEQNRYVKYLCEITTSSNYNYVK